MKSVQRKLRIQSMQFRIFLAEFAGTFLLMAFILGSIAQTTFGARTNNDYGGFFGGYMAGGCAVAMGMYISLSTSGGHINPAVTLAGAAIGLVKWTLVPAYWLGQYSGSFVAAACIFGVYNDALNNYDGGVRSVTGPNATAGIFATYPKPYVSIGGAIGDSVFSTMLLIIGALALIDPRNTNPDQGVVPLGVGLVVTTITFAFNLNISTAINPARDLSPRIFTAIAGWGNGVFSYERYRWFWIPWLIPHIGGVVGAFIYQLTISLHYPETHVEGKGLTLELDETVRGTIDEVDVTHKHYKYIKSVTQ